MTRNAHASKRVKGHAKLLAAVRAQYGTGTPAGLPLSRPGVIPSEAERTPKPLEHDEQREFFTWCETERHARPELAEFFAVPNGGHRAISVAKKMKAEGVKMGVEDVMCLIARGGYFGFLAELKRVGTSPSAVSAEQRQWHATHIKRGYYVVVCRGADELKAEALRYLSWPVTKVVHSGARSCSSQEKTGS